MDLLDDHIHAGVNFYATYQEIVREWQLMGEDTLEFEVAKKELAEEREKFNVEKKGLLWRVSDAEDKLAKEKQFNANKQEGMGDRLRVDQPENEYIQRIAKLEKIVAEKAVESEASKIFAEEAAADCKWLIAHGVPLKTDCAARYAEKRQEYEFLKFVIVKAVGKLSQKADGVEMLKKALGDEDPEAGDAGPSHQG
ncbi:hypothetical protein Hanom_Chr05g00418421 [Helianthus anomalus]